MKILLFRLEGPLQSWGEMSHWDVRETAYIPTKSAIVGLLSSCMGWHRDDRRIQKLNDAIKLGVRVDRQGNLLVDFHTVKGCPRLAVAGGGYRALDKSTIISRRSYLQDASFLVAITADDEIVEQLKNGLTNPCYVPFLGRKACIPSVPIIPVVRNEYSSIEEAFEKEPLPERYEQNDVMAEFDANTEVKGVLGFRPDSVRDFENRQFSERVVIKKTIHVEQDCQSINK